MAKRITIVLDWGENNMAATGPDGTEYGIFSEHVRGERRYYEAMYREPGDEREAGLEGGWKSVPIGDGGSDIRTQRARARRYAEQRQEAARA
jgi:hypothetical protein